MKRFLSGISLISLLCFTYGCQNDQTMVDLEQMRAQAEIEEQNKEMARNVFAAIDTGNFDRLGELFADDFALEVPGLPEPLRKDALFLLIKTHYAAFPDWIHVIENVAADGDTVAVKLTQNGTHKAEYEGIPATGVKVTLPAMHFFTIINGKAVDWFAVEDYLGLYMQLGMELKPKEMDCPSDARLSDDDRSALQQSVADMVRFTLAGDWEAVASYYSDDVTMMPPNADLSTGREALVAGYTGVTISEFSSKLVAVDGCGDVAYGRGQYSWTSSVADNPESVSESGKWVAIWRKQDDGRWLIELDINNADATADI